MKKKIFILTGEPSGDLHGENLLNELYKITPKENLEIKGIGSVHLRNTTCDVIFDSKNLSSVGLTEVLSKLSLYINLEKFVLSTLANFLPEVVVLVDFPGFNLRLCKKIKKYSPNSKIIYYMPPQVWAWNQGRTKTLAKYCDLVLCGLPFEEAFHRKWGVNSFYVGNPIVKELPVFNRDEIRKEFGLSQKDILVGVLPGSRNSEIFYMLNVYLKAIKLISKEFPDTRFIISKSNNVSNFDTAPDWKIIDEIKDKVKILPSLDQGNYKLMCASDLMMVSSGTATLQTALYETPLILGYRGNMINFFFFLLLKKVSMVGLPNIILNKMVVPELLQNDATSKNFAKHAIEWLKDKNKLNEIRSELKGLHSVLSEKNASEEVARKIKELIPDYKVAKG